MGNMLILHLVAFPQRSLQHFSITLLYLRFMLFVFTCYRCQYVITSLSSPYRFVVS